MPTEFWARAVQLGNMTNEERVKVRAARVQKHSDTTDTFYRITNATGDVATLDINDEIGFWGVSAADFSRDLDDITAPSVTVRINSPGGDVFDGIAILNHLRAHAATVNTVVFGLAASAASIIAQAGDTVTMMPGSQMMIHDASGMCFGNEAETRAHADLLGKISDNLASVYASKASGTAAEWREVMKGEQWYTADEAVEAGLADEVAPLAKKQKADEPEAAVENRWNLSFYNFDGRDSAPAPKAVVTAEPVAGPVDYVTLATAVIKALREDRETNGVYLHTTPADRIVVHGGPNPQPDPVDDDETEVEATTDDDEPDTTEQPPAAAAAPAATTDTTPAPVNTWNPDVFRARMKERAAAQ